MASTPRKSYRRLNGGFSLTVNMRVSVRSSVSKSGSASGHFQSSVDMMSGREVRSAGQLSYSAKWIFESGSLAEEVAGKAILEPAE